MPLLFDDWFSFAEEMEDKGRFDIAARIFRHIASIFGNTSFMNAREANALFHFGDYRSALEVLANMKRPSISTRLIEARCYVKLGEPQKAIIAYEKARKELE
jgi:tetratricopeptide (TPR) repeat protein